MTGALPAYPFRLERAQIAELIPHRGDIFFCESLIVEGPHDFKGVARWPLDNSIIKGHFPGLPVVPGVCLIEAMAQLAGAGLLAGDPYVQTLPEGLVGVLAAVRKCAFKRPVMPDCAVEFSISCRQLAPLAVEVSGIARVRDLEVAQLDVLMAYAAKEQLLTALEGA